MSGKPRCHDCGHARGLRSTGALTKGGHKCIPDGPNKCFRKHVQTEAGQTRKSPCACDCHAVKVGAAA